MLRLCFFVYFARYFSNPRSNRPWLLSYFEYSCALSHGKGGTVAAVTGFATVAKHYSFILAEVVVVVVVATSNPLNSWLFFYCGVEACVEGLAADSLFGVAEELVVVVEIDIFIEWDVHEEHSVAFGGIIIRNLVVGGAEPIYLIGVDTIVSSCTETTMITSV